MSPLILASGSEIRADLLRNCGVPIEVVVPRVDEEAIKEALIQSQAHPRDIADALAEAKSKKIAQRCLDRLVLGCDQVLEFQGQLLSKAAAPEEAVHQLMAMQGEAHRLLSAAVIYDQGLPVWRHVGQVRLSMRALSEDWVQSYVARNWSSVRHAVGAYRLEEEGPRLFSRIEGDYFNVLGMPLLEVLSYLTLRGTLTS